MKAKKLKTNRRPKPRKQSQVHDIIKLIEVNHEKNQLALTEIKYLCIKK